MKPLLKEIALSALHADLKSVLSNENNRVSMLTSVNGGQLVTVILKSEDGSSECWITPLDGAEFPSLTHSFPQLHWFERSLSDLFGLTPVGHPRLKPLFMHQCYDGSFAPLRATEQIEDSKSRQEHDFNFMTVAGEGVYEVPVGPVHAGIIEPGHFRLSCLGEIILNLELRLGFLHRGVEQRMTDVKWTETRFVAEAAASDTAAANAIANAIVIESLFGISPTKRAQALRAVALEIERIAMHVGDIGGMAVDLGYLGVAATFSRLRGTALGMAELLSDSRFIRGFIRPGGISFDPGAARLDTLRENARGLRTELEAAIGLFTENDAVLERLAGVGVLKPGLARDFGMVGVAARASGIAYDTRLCFVEAFPQGLTLSPPIEKSGDALARIMIRIEELTQSFELIEQLLESLPEGNVRIELPASLPPNQTALAVVESFRGELLHLVMTDENGRIKRYAIKDPSFNNWTGVAIAVRNNVLADFPICNKSFSLSYSGHDL